MKLGDFVMPDKNMYNYALKVKKQYPIAWSKGGNIYGNTAFVKLGNVIKRGYWLKSEEPFYKKWRGFVARHQHNNRLPGCIANLKWLSYGNVGKEYVHSLIEKYGK